MNHLNHLAIIADGNGRWAESRGLTRSDGHEQGLHKLDEVIRWCKELNITYLSVYVFSWDNWARPKEEVDALIGLANKYFDRYPEFIENNVRILVSGTREKLEEETISRIERVQLETANCDGIIVNLCANYSGKKEIEHAISCGAKTVEEIGAHMYQNLPPPDVLFRTGGHQRLSDFMLWQTSYTELQFSHTLFPDLSIAELRHIKHKFEREHRKFGGITHDIR